MIATIAYRSILVMIGFTVFSLFTSAAVQKQSVKSSVVIPEITPLQRRLPPLETYNRTPPLPEEGVVEVRMEMNAEAAESEEVFNEEDFGRLDIRIEPTAYNLEAEEPQYAEAQIDDSRWMTMRRTLKSLQIKCDNLNQTINERITNANQ